MNENYWDKLMGTDEGAANYMESYGEGPGFITRHTLGDLINDGESVLDVGCGPGWNYDHFKEYGPQVSDYKGLDYSERFVRVARQRVEAKYKVSGLMTFQPGDVRELREPDNSWDAVVLQDCLEHTNGYEKPVSEALRVARKRVIISFWHLVEKQEDEHLNINPAENDLDGWGYWYARPRWEEFLNKLSFVWHYLEVAPIGKTHKWDFYVIDKENS